MPRIGLIALALALVGLLGGQLVLPRIAERRLADDLSGTGDVQRATVRSVPARSSCCGAARTGCRSA